MTLVQRLTERIDGRILFVLGFILVCCAYEYGRILNLRPLPMHQWRQSDCLSLTWNYYVGHSTFASPAINDFISDDGTSGKSAGEFPMLYWGVAQVWKVIGQSEFAYRLIGLIFHFFGSFALYLTLRRILKSELWSICIALLWTTSPAIAYYSVSFLTDVPAFDLALIGWYFFVRHAQEHKRRYWVLAIAFWSLATLLKVTAGMSFLAVSAIYLLVSIMPSSAGKLKGVFPKILFGWGVVALGLIAILGWYVHAANYNDLHGGRYTFNGFWPLWEMTDVEIDAAILHAKNILVFQVFDTSVWLVIGIAWLCMILNARIIPRLVLIMNILLLIGTVTYTILWFHALDGHDYYFINPQIMLLVALVSWAWWLKGHHPDLFHARWMRWAVLLLLGYNVAYASNNLTMRSNPYKELNKKDLLPTYHDDEPGYWNSIANNSFFYLQTITPYLRSIGVKAEDLVVCIDDPSFNIALYLMGQRGFAGYGCGPDRAVTVEGYVELGAKYLIITKQSTLDDPNMKPLYTYPIGKYGDNVIFDMRELDRVFSAEALIDQSTGNEIPFGHRNDAVRCSNGTGWCYAGARYPFEINDVPVYDPLGGSHVQLIVRGELHFVQEDGVCEIVFAENVKEEQITLWPRELRNGPFEVVFNLIPDTRITTNKLFFSNNSGSGFRLDGFEVVVKRTAKETASARPMETGDVRK